KLALSVEQKRQLIEPEHPDVSLRRQCALLGLARSSLYREPKGHSERRPRAPGRRCIAPGAAASPRPHAPFGAVAVSHNTATALTGPGQAVAPRPPADTARAPGCRRAPPRV